MTKVYVGNLPLSVTDRDIEDLFAKFGKIRNIQVKIPPRPPAYAFVEFSDPRDADDAVEARDGYEFNGARIRVEVARGRERKREFRGSPLRSKYRVVVKGLPSTASWQDLKDHMRKAGEVTFTDVDHKGYGIVEYKFKEDMEYALKKLDDSEFKNPFDRGTIRVYKAKSSSRSRSDSRRRSRRSRSRKDSRSKSRSARRSRSRRRSPSHSHSRSRSHSKSHSKSKSKSKSVSSRSSSAERKSDRSRSHSRKDEHKSEPSSRSNSSHRFHDDDDDDDDNTNKVNTMNNFDESEIPANDL